MSTARPPSERGPRDYCRGRVRHAPWRAALPTAPLRRGRRRPRSLVAEFDAEVERWRIEVHGLSREDLIALIESSTCEIPATRHRVLHLEAGDFVRWGRRGGQKTLLLYGRPYFSLLACFRWSRVELRTLAEYRAEISNGSGSR